MDSSSSTIRMVRRPAMAVKGRQAGAPRPTVVVAAAAGTAVVLATAVVVGVVIVPGVDAAGARVVHAAARRAGAARVVRVLGLITGAGDVHAALGGCLSGRRLPATAGVVRVLGLVTGAGDVDTRLVVVVGVGARGVVLRRGRVLDGLGDRVRGRDRVVGALGSHHDGGEDAEEGDSENECECSTHGHHDRAGVVKRSPGARQGSVRTR